jgi:multimeric flavodoxin WrbA
VKVLGIAAGPRSGGNTDLLLEALLQGAAAKGAETEVVYLRKLKFVTCNHGDSCLKTGACNVKDEMQGIYKKLAEADVVVLASPVQFAGMTAPLKAMIDRCQCLWARKYLLKVPPLLPEKPRKGFFISVAGTRLKNMFESSLIVIKTFFHVINVEYAGELTVSGVDEKGAVLRHPDVTQQAYEWGQKLVTN